MNIDARLGLFACNMNDIPENETMSDTPGVSLAIFSIRATAALVRSSEDESGN